MPRLPATGILSQGSRFWEAVGSLAILFDFSRETGSPCSTGTVMSYPGQGTTHKLGDDREGT